MKKNLINLSGKIDSQRLDAIETISKVATFLDIPFFLIGASARDMLLAVHNITIHRATLDLDFGVRVPNWDEFKKLKNGLVETGKFTLTREDQRIKFKDNFMIDLIPFGPISDEKYNIKWPSQENVMHILGFKEAFKYSHTVRLRSKPILDIKIVTLAGLALMKILAWKDKYPERTKDAADLLLIIRSYTDAGNFERILDEMPHLLESDDFDYTRAGARLLGRDIAKILITETKVEVISILNQETGDQDRYRLIEDMLRSDIGRNTDFENILSLLEDLKKGILEPMHVQ